MERRTQQLPRQSRRQGPLSCRHRPGPDHPYPGAAVGARVVPLPRQLLDSIQINGAITTIPAALSPDDTAILNALHHPTAKALNEMTQLSSEVRRRPGASRLAGGGCGGGGSQPSHLPCRTLTRRQSSFRGVANHPRTVDSKRPQGIIRNTFMQCHPDSHAFVFIVSELTQERRICFVLGCNNPADCRVRVLCQKVENFTRDRLVVGYPLPQIGASCDHGQPDLQTRLVATCSRLFSEILARAKCDELLSRIDQRSAFLASRDQDPDHIGFTRIISPDRHLGDLGSRQLQKNLAINIQNPNTPRCPNCSLPAQSQASPRLPCRGGPFRAENGVVPADVVAPWSVGGRGLVGRWESRCGPFLVASSTRFRFAVPQ